MDVTPTPKMLEFMQKFTDGVVGAAPLDVEKSPGAEGRRRARGLCMNMLHDLVRLSMREGVGRYLNQLGQRTVEDQIIPSAVQVPGHERKQ